MRDMVLFYDKGAAEWYEALPMGNGRLGAMVYGTETEERIQLNEESLWSGFYDKDADNPLCLEHLEEMRRLVFEGKNAEAEEMSSKYLVCGGRGSTATKDDEPYGTYQTAGELFIKLHRDRAKIENFRRDLNITNGVASVQYTADGAGFNRTYICCPKYNVTAGKISSGTAGAVNAVIRFDRENADIVYYKNKKDAFILIRGGFVIDRGISYATSIRVKANGENAVVTCERLSGVTISNADSFEFYLSTTTTYADKMSPSETAMSNVDSAYGLGFEEMMRATKKRFEMMMTKATIDVNSDKSKENIPTDKRLSLMKAGERDDALIELYWQFGRYLLFCSSYNCVLPANLQGVWANGYQNPWSCDYHININIQMNYWLAELTSLPELEEVFFGYIRFIAKCGVRTAKVQYGCNGWVAHTITTPWGFTAPGEGASWGSFMCAGAWCVRHIWDHYLFSGDKKFLSENYDIIKGACEFFLDFLVTDPRSGYLVTAPSNSPENRYFDPETGKSIAICAGPTMDNCILYELFTILSDSSKVLGTDAAFAEKVIAAREKLPPLKIGKHGQIMEWQEDYDEPEIGHRHVSPLYALHPANLITKSKTPDLFAAAEKLIERRLSSGGGHTGWSRAWIINFYARLFNGEECYTHINQLLTKSTLNNLFDNHPPFQIDGNFGGTSGITEMMLQSHEDHVSLLPSLPEAWNTGSFTGLRARGGFSIDAQWSNGKPTSFTVTSEQGGTVTIQTVGNVYELTMEKGEVQTIKCN